MTLQFKYYEVVDPALSTLEFQQTPIFIGTATKKVVVPMIPGVYSLAIPQTEAGTKYRDDLFDLQVKYWKIFGTGSLSLISPARRDIQVGGQSEAFQVSREQLKTCVLFIVNGGSIIFSTPIDSIEFTIINGKFYIKDAHLLFPLPTSLPTLDCIFAYPSTLSNPSYSLVNNRVVLDPLPNQLVASNLDTIIESDYSFYYDIVDFRWTRLKYLDPLPVEFEYNPYNKLGTAAMLHRRISSADMTLYSVPNESLSSIESVLAELELNPSKYGYAIVPLWIDSQVSNTIAAYVQALATTETGFQISYISTSLPVPINIFPSSIEGISCDTHFDGSYGFGYGEEYGRDAD